MKRDGTHVTERVHTKYFRQKHKQRKAEEKKIYKDKLA